MTPSLIAASLWALAGTVTAFLPMRYQMIPGGVLVLSAIPLMIWVGAENGWVWTLLALLAFLSMMRRPLGVLIAKARGRNPRVPR